ncbi:hypothetical protein KSC_074830 [Ktedonobacter sp. SOSP1-52]|uniref:hypothetical protein n=1 Tax=Ktedonobacter sp. SOSP1-52 TaxID=2778366 RepID=UPI001916687F|nr:hypothetical protein [Ktedonobacter sp. SOSP1-52]GHO68591.1 hypothetical protein KSC_074830 [Ktedonobacter sp. SOSP1-52]
MQQTHLDQFSMRYPHLAAAFAHIPQAEEHLRRIQDLNQSWQGLLLSGASRDDDLIPKPNPHSGGRTTSVPSASSIRGHARSGFSEKKYVEVVANGITQDLPAVDTFDIIYAGGGLNLLHAAVMTLRYNLRVLVFDRFTVGAVHREWNISREELNELLAVGLLTSEELEQIIQREYMDGLVRFSSEYIGVPTAELHLQDVLNIAVDAERLTQLCIQKIQAHQPRGGQANLILHQTTFERCVVDPQHNINVHVSTHNETHLYAAHLLVDGMGSTSPIACQLNCGRPFSLVCPTVGTVARGYKQGSAPDAIDPTLGEILVTTEDVRRERQLIWEAFPGRDEQVAIYLFYYAETGQRVDLFELFDDFFALLPDYKDTSEVEILKPVYGFIPAGYNITLPWQQEQKVLAYDRVISLGDAAAFQSPLTFCGFGSYVRNLRRITTLLAYALEHDLLSASNLDKIRASEAVPAVARAFSKFMIAKPAGREVPWQVNETLNVFCRVLYDLGPRVTNDFFKDRIGWLDYTRVVLNTPKYYPAIYRLALSTLAPTEILGWIMAWLKLGRQSAIFTLYWSLYPLVRTLLALPPMRLFLKRLEASSPRRAFAVRRHHALMAQVARNRTPYQPKPEAISPSSYRKTPKTAINRLGHWLGSLWPHS